MKTQEIMGRQIKKLREELNLSQTELAHMVGYKDKTAIAKIEAGKVNLPQSKISAFAQALKTEISYLFDTIPDEDFSGSRVSDLEKQIIIAYRKSDPIDKEMVLRILKIERKNDAEKLA